MQARVQMQEHTLLQSQTLVHQTQEHTQARNPALLSLLLQHLLKSLLPEPQARLLLNQQLHKHHASLAARSQRQQAVLIGIKNKLISLGALENAPAFYKKLRHAISTDIDLEIVEPTLKIIGNPADYKFTNINLTQANVFNPSTGPAGQFILIPKAGVGNWQPIHTFITNNLNQNNN